MELSRNGIHRGHYSATGFPIQEDIMRLIFQVCGSLALIIIFLYGFLIGVLETFFISSEFVPMLFMISQEFIQIIENYPLISEVQEEKFILIPTGGINTH